jgi:hypothetical protein
MFDSPISLKSNALTKWYENMMHRPSSNEVSFHHAKKDSRVIGAARGGGEGVLTGAALAVVHANAPNGLDVSLKQGGATIPIDAVIGAGGLIMGGADAHNIGVAAAGVFSFRKTMDLMAEKKAQKGQKNIGTVGAVKTGVHGDFGEDPILREARGL